MRNVIPVQKVGRNRFAHWRDKDGPPKHGEAPTDTLDTDLSEAPDKKRKLRDISGYREEPPDKSKKRQVTPVTTSRRVL